MKACQILGCNSEYFSRYTLSNFLFYYAVLHSRLKWLPLYKDGGLKLAMLNSVFARIERGQGADLGKGHFCARPIILRVLLRVILHFEGTMGK